MNLPCVLCGIWAVLGLPAILIPAIIFSLDKSYSSQDNTTISVSLGENQNCSMDICKQSCINMDESTKYMEKKMTQERLNLEEYCFEKRSATPYVGVCHNLEGWLVSCISLAGLIGNITAVVVLRRMLQKRSRMYQGQFQHYLIILSVVDSFLLLLFLLDNVIIDQVAAYQNALYYAVVPFFSHPVKSISFTMSMLWVVVVSVERFLAITQPFQMRNNLSAYVIFMVIFSTSINWSKFFEIKPISILECGGSVSYFLTTSRMASNRIYIMWGSYYDQLILQGILPLGILVFCYYRISSTIESSTKMRLLSSKGGNSQSFRTGQRKMHQLVVTYDRQTSNLTIIEDSEDASHQGQTIQQSEEGFVQDPYSSPPPALSNYRCLNISLCVTSENVQIEESPFWKASKQAATANKPTFRDNAKDKCGGPRNKARYDHAPLIMVVLTFLLCHSLRFVSKLYEILIIDHYLDEERVSICSSAGRHAIPSIWFCVVNFNHVLIVLNSSLNFYIYCVVGKRFRTELFKLGKILTGKGKWWGKISSGGLEWL